LETTDTIGKYLKEIIDFLDGNQIKYALAGGLAFGTLVEPQATMDIDILILINKDKFPEIISRMKQKFDKIIPYDSPMHFKSITIWRVLFFEQDKTLIGDFLLAESEYHQNIVKRAIDFNFEGKVIKVVTLEDLILLKNSSLRDIDKNDIAKIYLLRGDEIDNEYLKNWSSKLGIKLYIPD
jgi:hypothetical protein